ncbi:hypothetical protein J4208_02110 [Candidatus Woesearchaeota archaeon]|nr:hypothetical protein [Candidatus Woesearchaeota archaeon]
MTDLRLYTLKNRKDKAEQVLVVADENNNLLVDQAIGESNLRFSREVIRRQWLVESLRIFTRNYDVGVREYDGSKVEESCRLYSPGTIVDLIVKIDPANTLKVEDRHLIIGRGRFEVVSGENVADAKIREWMDRYQAIMAQNVEGHLRCEDEIGILEQRIEKLRQQRQQEAQALSRSISLQQLLN